MTSILIKMSIGFYHESFFYKSEYWVLSRDFYIYKSEYWVLSRVI